jgi:hypothetical protein
MIQGMEGIRDYGPVGPNNRVRRCHDDTKSAVRRSVE